MIRKQNPILVTVMAVGMVAGGALVSVPLDAAFREGSATTVAHDVTTMDQPSIGSSASVTAPTSSTTISFSTSAVVPAAPAATTAAEVEIVVVTSAERLITAETNAVRASIGVAPLAVNAELTAYARAWAEHMAVTGTISHSNIGSLLDGWMVVGENVAQAGDAAVITDTLVGSEAHLSTMIQDHYTDIGVGVVVDEEGQVWAVQVFGGEELPTTTTTLVPVVTTTTVTLPDATTTIVTVPDATTTTLIELPDVPLPTLP